MQVLKLLVAIIISMCLTLATQAQEGNSSTKQPVSDSQTAEFDDQKCALFLDALAARVSPPSDLTVDFFLSCSEKAAELSETLLEDALNNKDKSTVQVDSDTNRFFHFKKDDLYSDAAFAFRRDISSLLSASSSQWHIVKMSHGPMLAFSIDQSKKAGERARTKAGQKAHEREQTEAEKAAKQAVRDTFKQAILNLRIAEGRVLRLMDQRGLLDPLSALLQTYVVAITNVGNTDVPSALTAVNQGNQVKAAGYLDFESEHFKARNGIFSNFDLSFGGRFGVTPEQTLVTLTPPATTNPKPVYTLFQNAFLWELNGRVGLPWGRRAEVSLPVFRFGQTILLDDSILVGPNSNQSTSLVPNNKGRGAWYWELAPQYRIYPRLVELIHYDKKFLSPSFDFASGFRRDSRFQPTVGSGIETFANPVKRWFIRSFVNLMKVNERNPSGKDASNPFDVAIGVEYDAVWGHSGGKFGPAVPPSTKIFVNASIDLVKAFTKQGETAK